jgi:hypothetical protein
MNFSVSDNVILHQADVDFASCKEWIINIKARNETYVTTNFFDETLRNLSSLVNPTRLGQVKEGVFTPPGVAHVDFTSAEKVETQHWFFGNFPNQRIKTFCTRAIQGEDANTVCFRMCQCLAAINLTHLITECIRLAFPAEIHWDALRLAHLRVGLRHLMPP